MSTVKNQIELRHGRRCDIENQAKKLRPPSIHSKASKSDFSKLVNNLTEEFAEECLLVTHDVKVLIMAIYLMEQDGLMPGAYLDEAWKQCPLEPERQAELDRRAFEQAEAREKAAKSDKKQGELDGQLKIFDDGSTAEAATDVVTVNDVTPESHRLPDYGNLADSTLADEEAENLPDEIDKPVSYDLQSEPDKKAPKKSLGRPKKK